MRTTSLLFFYLMLCCQTTESLTLKAVILGTNVTLDCELDVKEIFWLFMKPAESLVVIYRTSSAESIMFSSYDERLQNKYLSRTESRLFIRIITKDELGIYYCAKVNTSLQLSNGTKLYTETNNQTDQPQHQTAAITSISIISLFLITIVTVLGLLTLKCEKPRKSRQHNVKVKQFDDLNAEEFTEVEFRPCE
ncbi:hypothetical protein E1301_Tti012774 [Triplophysa tibetana]|uniref:Immunoglobulin V-set domain-containing protein n=1 Tax=Triplophysa tibetana TaxID=1572043 RepID=A0A5A9NSS5_9TELE|nr:hypothetical protein E1301_Tti012774 [Triplophysa tibetana]